MTGTLFTPDTPEELTARLHSAEAHAQRAKTRLRTLLQAIEQMTLVRDKFFAMIQASNSLLQELPLYGKVEVGMYFQEKGAEGRDGYAFFQLGSQASSEGEVTLKLDSVQEMQHSFYQTLPEVLLRLLETHESKRCFVADSALYVPLVYEENLVGLLVIRGGYWDLLSQETQEAIDTLSQFLALFLENLSFTLELEQKVRNRTQALNHSLQELESKNTALTLSYRKLDDLHQTNQHLLHKLGTLHEVHLKGLQDWLDRLLNSLNVEDKLLAQQTLREIQQVEALLRPVAALYFSEKAIRQKRVLLADTDKKQQIIAKMALGGTGVELDIVSNLEEGQHYLDQGSYDILCVDETFLPLAQEAHQRFPDLQSVFMTSAEASVYLPLLLQYPFLSNAVSRHKEDRTFTLKHILTTVSKLLNRDLFGLEKYLSWGVEVQQLPITQSEKRTELVQQMEQYLERLGVRRTMLSKCAMVAEELLMNAIYDAPVDGNGRHLYNHLMRTSPVMLAAHEQGKFSYACDGMLVALAVEDPFGSLERTTILEYLAGCYRGEKVTRSEHGGAGLGLFQIMETADLMVINVKPGTRTEVITIFNIDPNKPKHENTNSFHYFYG